MQRRAFLRGLVKGAATVAGVALGVKALAGPPPVMATVTVYRDGIMRQQKQIQLQPLAQGGMIESGEWSFIGERGCELIRARHA